MKLVYLLSLATAALSAPTKELEARQSTQWIYTCNNRRAPDNFKAFDVGGCAAQLSFNKDRYIGIQWSFDAIYADGSRVEYTPYRDNNFGVSDTFYPFLGNNFLTKFPGSSAFTAVHEFSNVCRDGRAPTAWVFRANPSSNTCTPSGYSYTTDSIPVASGSRPAKVSGTALRRIDNNGNFEVTWNAVSEAAAYSVIVEYPTGEDELGDPYRNVRGERIQAGATRAVIPTGTRVQSDPRKAIVHAVNSQGVWSFTNDVRGVAAPW